MQAKTNFLKNIFRVVFNQKTWVGYLPTKNEIQHLPPLKSSVLSPKDGLSVKIENEATLGRLNFLYAKDYSTNRDLEIVWMGWRKLGN